MIKKIRFGIWFVRGLLKRHWRWIIISFVASVLIAILGVQIGPFVWSKIQQQRVIIGLIGSYTPTDLPNELQNLISSGLTKVDISGEITPALAVSWDINDDATIYTFKLRQDIKWHDGEQFTAYDVNYNLKDVELNPLEKYILEIKLKEPFAPLPSFLSKPLFKKGLIGLGSYEISKIQLKGNIVSYLKLTPLASDLPTLEIRFYPSETILKTAFKLGEVTVIDEIQDPDPFFNWDSVEIKDKVEYHQYLAIFFNLDNPLFKEREVRQALAYAIEKPKKNRVATPISRKSWAYTDQVKQYEKDIDKIEQLIGDGLDETITFSTFHQYQSVAESIASQWNDVGINTEVKLIDHIENDFQALLVLQEVQADPDQYPLWHSTQTDTNLTRYVNPKIDKLLEDGRKELDQEKRQQIYFDFQRYLVEDAPAVFLYHPVVYTISRK